MKSRQMAILGTNSAIDLTGRRFGRLVVTCRTNVRSGVALWWCECDCGNDCTVATKNLRSGDTRSCGCLKAEYIATGKIRHGHAVGGKLTREYRAFRGMMERCYNPKKQNYRFYGGRGVTVCSVWRSKRNGFSNFFNQMGPCPEGYTLDRIDPDGNYEKDNCRWASWEVQHKNTRRAKRLAVLPSAESE